jgi:hypothetical protein
MMVRWLMVGLLSVGAAHAEDMVALRYLDQDPGTPTYVTRILVTPDFMRMDGGDDAGDFVLLDRRHRKVINVMHANEMAIVFKAGKLPAKPASWKSQLTTQKTPRGTQFTLTVDGEVCNEGVAAKKAAPDAARAMAELKAVLASMQYRVWNESPAALQHRCDLANQVWETGTTLKLGLPIQERAFSGRTRTFESETRLPIKPEMFRVPQGMPLVDAPS